MKKFILFALFGVLVASCSIDDNSVMDNQLVGSWKYLAGRAVSPSGEVPVTPLYIRFDGKTVYSSNTLNDSIPKDNGKGYVVTFDSSTKSYVLDIAGERKYNIAVPVGNLLDISYVITPANEATKTPAVMQSLPYQRVKETK